MAAKPDPALKARLDGYIDRIAAAAAKDPDGYINTYTQLKEPTHRWGQNGGNERYQHDIYNLGCLVDAGIHYYRATGETKLLATAVRAVNGMCKVMGPPPRQNIVPGHALPEEAVVKLHELFKAEPKLKESLGVLVNETDYLALAKFWFDARGHHEGRTDFGSYNQDGTPALQQTTIEGHAVRAALFASGLIAYGVAANDTQYVDVAEKLWHNMVGRRMYITGGIGSFANDEKFGPDYVLPNDGYLETCSAVASCFFSENLNHTHGNAQAIDEFERSLYNNALAGVAIEGNSYFYENPLQAGVKRHRWLWHGCPCCPPMFLKLMGALPGSIYATDVNGSVYVNLFIGSKATMKLQDATVLLTQTTQYPWQGDVHLTVEASKPITTDVYVRVPEWARNSESPSGLYKTVASEPSKVTLSVNGQDVSLGKLERGYARIHREWRTGDSIDLRLTMPVRRVVADEKVESTRDHVALMRGPIVYCVESIDAGDGVQNLFLPDDAAITPKTWSDQIGGVTVLDVKGIWALTDGRTEAALFTMIPYYANANRGPVEMKTWLPRTAGAVR
ncbi:MAG: glycoside hydrolase family 127 protein [Tepidisphaeraceae bacterium]